MKSKKKMNVKSKKVKKNKITLKEKFALAVFMESVPKIIDLWLSSGTNLPLDEWLLDLYYSRKENNV